MLKFQKDDVVKCIDASNTPNLVEGTTYRVDDCNEHYVDLSIDTSSWHMNDWFVPSKFSPDRFELSSGKPTYVWPVYVAPSFPDEDGDNVEESSYEELKLRLEQAEELLDKAQEHIIWWQDEHPCCKGAADNILKEIDLFLE